VRHGPRKSLNSGRWARTELSANVSASGLSRDEWVVGSQGRIAADRSWLRPTLIASQPGRTHRPQRPRNTEGGCQIPRLRLRAGIMVVVPPPASRWPGGQQHRQGTCGRGVGRQHRRGAQRVKRISNRPTSAHRSQHQNFYGSSTTTNAVLLRGLICIATITLDNGEPGNHTLATPRTMKTTGPFRL